MPLIAARRRRDAPRGERGADLAQAGRTSRLGGLDIGPHVLSAPLRSRALGGPSSRGEISRNPAAGSTQAAELLPVGLGSLQAPYGQLTVGRYELVVVNQFVACDAE